MYEVFTGGRPFAGRSNLACMRMIADAEPVAPRRVVAELPVRLEEIILRCLEKRPEKRYATAREMVLELRALVAEKPVVAAPQSRRLVVYGMAAVLLVGAAVALPGVRRELFPATGGGAGSASDDYRAGRVLLDRYDKAGNIDNAVKAMQSAIARDANYAPAYAGLSEAYLRRNTVAPDPNWVGLARDAAGRAVALNPDLAIAHVALGNALFQAGRRAEAIAAFGRARDLDPKNAMACVGEARALAAEGKPDEAGRLFQKAIELDPAGWIPANEYGVFLYGGQHYPEALDAWEKARKLTPDNVRVLRNEAAGYHMAGREDDSASALQSALEIAPNAEIYKNLGTLRFFQGRFSDAVPLLEKAAQLAATDYNNWGNLGDAYRWAPGMQAKAAAAYSTGIDLLRRALTATPEDAELRAILAGFRAKSNQAAAALDELENFKKLPNKSGRASYEAAIAYEVTGHRDEALQWLEAAVRSGFSTQEIKTEQELASLRTDIRYQRLLASVPR